MLVSMPQSSIMLYLVATMIGLGRCMGSAAVWPYGDFPWTNLTSDANCLHHNYKFFDRLQEAPRRATVRKYGWILAQYPVESFRAEQVLGVPRECFLACRDVRPRVPNGEVKERIHSEMRMQCPKGQKCTTAREDSFLRPHEPLDDGVWAPKTRKARCRAITDKRETKVNAAKRSCLDSGAVQDRNVKSVYVQAEPTKRRRTKLNTPSDIEEGEIVEDARASGDAPTYLQLIDKSVPMHSERQENVFSFEWDASHIALGHTYEVCVYSTQGASYDLSISLLSS